MTCNFKPLNQRVLILPADAETMSKGGIIIPEGAKEQPQKGTILAIADDIAETSVTLKELKAGMEISYGKYSGASITVLVDDKPEDCLILSANDILGINLK